MRDQRPRGISVVVPAAEIRGGRGCGAGAAPGRRKRKMQVGAVGVMS